jgi:hypothetical protein
MQLPRHAAGDLAYRVPQEWLLELRNDTDREVRITVTDRLPELMTKRFGRLCVAVT